MGKGQEGVRRREQGEVRGKGTGTRDGKGG